MDADMQGRKTEATITKVVDDVKAEVTDLLTINPEFTGNLTVRLNFKDGFCPNINYGTEKSKLVQKKGT